jgi:hypothetical protein
MNAKITEKQKEQIARYRIMKEQFGGEIAENLAPMFYHTLTHEGDRERQSEMLELEGHLKNKGLI